jgi:hypothetical protein
MPFGIGRGLKKLGRSLDKIGPEWSFLHGVKGDTSASELKAKIAREQWEDYKTRFQPLENILLGYAGNKGKFVSDAMGQAQTGVNNAYSGGQAQTERRLQSYGLQVTPEVQQRIAGKLQFQKGLAGVQAQNMAARQAEDQVSSIIGGGLSLGARSVGGTK